MVTQWQIDPEASRAGFSVRHMMISKVQGRFTRLSGALRLDRDNPANSSVEAVIDAASIDTRDAKRDEEVKGAGFLDVREFPSIAFRSTRVCSAGGAYQVAGDLTIHGVTREVVLAVEGMEAESKDRSGSVRIRGTATTRIKRKDFGLSWSAALEAGGVLVSDEVAITLEVQFVRQP
jgi:polyisoprenoid-binding protein YceI